MTYLITQILLCLVIAFLLGLLVGYLLCKICCKSKRVDSAENDVGKVTAPAPAAFTSAYVEEEDDAVIMKLDTDVDLESDEYKIETLEGIGPQTGDLLRGYGVATVGDYLRKLHKASARAQAAKDLNILEKPLHDWACMADLLRINGVDHQYAELLFAAGIQTVSDLGKANASELTAEMVSVNEAGKQLISPTIPEESAVAGWIDRARSMSPVVTV